ncbi:guanine-N(7)--methyltransferase-like protein [Hyaloraphidium curvatum]|nr:guanine-N(7)--methyltransferase-like protein [Hyaloraphidium curvatum]
MSSSEPPSAPVSLPQKRFFRQRAHVNVLSDHFLRYPRTPRDGDWAEMYPAFVRGTKRPAADDEEGGRKRAKSAEEGAVEVPAETVEVLDVDEEEERERVWKAAKKVEFADIGCGYGGLMIELSPLFPDTLMLGMEIRHKVCAYVDQRIKALRAKAKEEGGQAYENIAVVRGNAMKYMANFFEKGQLKKIFFLYPDPNFKRRTHSRRIISPNLLSEYAYHLAVGGLLYTCTDVLALHEWMVDKLGRHPLYERLSEEEVQADPCREAVWGGTEEGKKVERNGGGKWMSIWRRIEA